MREKLTGALNRMESARTATAIRSGLTMVIPVLLIGAAALILRSLPIPAYQALLQHGFGAFCLKALNLIYNVTFGMLSVFVTATVSYSDATARARKESFSFGAVLASLIAFFILVGAQQDALAWDALGVKGMFTAILSAGLVTPLYDFLEKRMQPRQRPYSTVADASFTRALGAFFPILLIAVLFALLNNLIAGLFGVSSLHELFITSANALFGSMGRGVLSGMLMVLLSSLLWFFGIHGSDVLEGVMQNLFTPATAINQAWVSVGQAPTEIFCKEFFDVFVLMGGCGTALCLLIALLLFSKRPGNRRLSRLAALPMLFNINEVMIFGLPVIYNPTLLVPFILTPLAAFFVSYGAMATGLVPLITKTVDWTTPVFFGGYQATGSLAGSALQLVNLLLGVLIYTPFVRAFDRRQASRAQRYMEELTEIMKRSEESVEDVTLTALPGVHGVIARSLAADLTYAMEHQALQLYYQPQYDNHGRFYGAEALLRWFHPQLGAIYPPLIIALARESGQLAALERRILLRAVADAKDVWAAVGEQSEFSINVAAETLGDRDYMDGLQRLLDEDPSLWGRICLEITEQTAMRSNSETEERFREVRALGYRFAIDDFSMGHTSLSYLQENHFDLVKLDGALVRSMSANPRSREIVASIVQLSRSLGFAVLAEYVETEKMRAELEEIGCCLYQGWLFSPAVPKEALIDRLTAEAAASAQK